MSANRFCLHGGRVVGGNQRLPEDPCEYQAASLATVIGCNRMACPRCQAKVRWSAPGWVGKEDLRPKLAELYGAQDWTDHPLLAREHDSYRLYACRCTLWAGVSDYWTADPDRDTLHEPELPWRCQGHPLPSLPVTLGDTAIAVDSDWRRLVARILDGWSPVDLGAQPGDAGPGLRLAWLYAYLVGLPEADAFSKAVGATLVDPDTQKAAAALYFFERFPHAEGFEALVRQAEDKPQDVLRGFPLLDTLRSIVPLEPIVQRLATAPGPRRDLDRRALEVFRAALLTPRGELSTEPAGAVDLVEAYRVGLAGDTGQLSPKAERRVALLTRTLELTRQDIPAQLLSGLPAPTPFDERELTWLADHVVDLERAGSGRWESVLNLLVRADLTRADELGHLIVVAALGLVRSGLVPPSELSAWLNRRGRAQPWALPIRQALGELPAEE
jgi:hypothetical protein